VSRPIVIAGGGTGGHVFVAQAVADALVGSGESPSDLRFVGSRRGQEARLLAGSETPLSLLPGRGIVRSFRPRALIQNIGATIGLGYSIVVMALFFATWKPRVVVSVGGYAALPAGIAAGIWRRPLVLVNIDAIPGSTHRFLARFATASAVISTETDLPGAVVTGAPVREEFEDLDRSPAARHHARQMLGCDPDRPFIAIVTGSLGARSVNSAVVELARQWNDKAVTIFHVTGQRDFSEISEQAPSDLLALNYRLVAFESDMATLYQASDIVVCRAGALTVAELGVVGFCAVMVPLPGAPGDHQTKNAQAVVNAGAGWMISDADVSPERLGDVLQELLMDPDEVRHIEQAARAFGRPHAAERVAELVLKNG